ncbi:hypothetical protein GWI33_003491, partial [Rhynchophorus ferrugineus]
CLQVSERYSDFFTFLCHLGINKSYNIVVKQCPINDGGGVLFLLILNYFYLI